MAKFLNGLSMFWSGSRGSGGGVLGDGRFGTTDAEGTEGADDRKHRSRMTDITNIKTRTSITEKDDDGDDDDDDLQFQLEDVDEETYARKAAPYF
jgi:hypothetical protein